MQTHEFRHLSDCFTLDNRVSTTQVVPHFCEHVVGGVLLQNVQNESLFDSLSHRVGVKRHILARLIRVRDTELRESLLMRSGSQCYKTQVFRVSDSLIDADKEFISRESILLFLVNAKACQRLLHRGRSLTMLGRMSLIDNHRILAVTGDNKKVLGVLGFLFQSRCSLHQSQERLNRTDDDLVTLIESALELS